MNENKNFPNLSRTVEDVQKIFKDANNKFNRNWPQENKAITIAEDHFYKGAPIIPLNTEFLGTARRKCYIISWLDDLMQGKIGKIETVDPKGYKFM